MKRQIAKNKKIALEGTISFGNFLKYYDELIKAREDNYYNFEKFIDNINAENLVYSKKWLLIKIEEIKNRNSGS